MKAQVTICFVLSLVAGSALAGTASAPNSHAPIGVMGDHLHNKGEVMFSYRYMRMHMEDNRDGSAQLSTAEVLNDFVVSPLEMTTEMHMLGAMYAPSDWLTLMLMGSVVSKEMDHITRTDVTFTTEADGIGDTKLMALVSVNPEGHLNLGVSAPTGSIDERDNNPRCQMMNTCPSRLPYPMQIGSGTWDITLGYTHQHYQGRWNVGGQILGIGRMGRNSQGYSLGNRAQATGWFGANTMDWLSLSGRLDFQMWEDIDGEDNQLRNLPNQFIPTARTDLRGGERLSAGVGANLLIAGTHRIAAEILLPVFQQLDGPQLESKYMATVGYQLAFGGHGH